MRYRMYAKTNGVEQLFYDSESGSQEMSIAQPQLKLELSKAGTLEFSILPTHPLYDSFSEMKTYVRVLQDNDEIFRGRVLQIEDTMYMERKVQCEGDLAYLIDSLQPPQQASTNSSTTDQTKTNASANAQYGGHASSKSITTKKINLGNISNTSSKLAAQFIRYINAHNSQMELDKRFTVGYVTLTDIGDMSFSASGYRDTKSAIDSDLLRQYGGYLRTRKNSNGPTFIDWLKEPSDVSSQPIRLGLNMVDLKKQMKGDDLFTVLVPIGDADLTIASVNNGSIELVNTAGVAKYGKIYKTQTYNGITNPTELKKLGQAYMNANYSPDKLSFTIKAIDMHLLSSSIDAIHVGSVVTVVSEPHGIQEALVCTAIEYDIQNPENNSYEIGDPSETMSQKSAADLASTRAATKSASKSAGRASSAAGSVTDVVNRHAENIMDTADLLYKLDADLVQVHARCIEITAQEKVTVTADTLEINAKGKIDMTAGGDINMTSTSLLKLGDTVYIGREIVDPYSVYVYGETWMQGLTIGGWLNIGGIEDETEAKWQDGTIKGLLSVSANSYMLTQEGQVTGYLEDAISELQIVPPSSTGTGMYKLQKKTFYDNNWTDVGNFTSATTLSGRWSGRNYIVTATPQGNIQTGIVYDGLVPTGQVTKSGKTVYQNFIVYSDDGEGDADQIIMTKSVGIYAGSVYEDGQRSLELVASNSWDYDENLDVYQKAVRTREGTNIFDTIYVDLPDIDMDIVAGTASCSVTANSHNVDNTNTKYLYLKADNDNCYITKTNSTPSSGSSGNIVAQITNPKTGGQGVVTAITSSAIASDIAKVANITLGVSGTNIETFAGDSTFSLSTGTFVVSNKTTPCVVLKHGSVVIGRLNAQSIYDDGYNAAPVGFVTPVTEAIKGTDYYDGSDDPGWGANRNVTTEGHMQKLMLITAKNGDTRKLRINASSTYNAGKADAFPKGGDNISLGSSTSHSSVGMGHDSRNVTGYIWYKDSSGTWQRMKNADGTYRSFSINATNLSARVYRINSEDEYEVYPANNLIWTW